MKKLLFYTILLFSSIPGFSQKAATFQKAIESGISIKTLDSLYKPALSGGADSIQAAFYGKYKNFIPATQRFLTISTSTFMPTVSLGVKRCVASTAFILPRKEPLNTSCSISSPEN